MKKLLFRLVIVLILAAAAWGGYSALKSLPQRQQSSLATTKVRQGDIVVRTFARGELRAVRSAPLTAPNLFGTVQVTKLAALGAFAKEKDLIAEFDDSELLSRVEEKQLEIDQIDESIKKSRADLAIRDNQDQVELLSARYAVRRAELEVKRNELISDIDAKRNNLSLEEARRRLQKLESDIKSRREQAQAELAVLAERKNKANLEMARERMRLNQVKLLAPMSGLVAIKQNRGTGFFFSGMTLPDIREGDQLQPGMPVADILDLSELEVIARIGELDRANLREGQDVVMRLDALSETRLHGKIKSMSGTASANVFSSDPAKKFDVLFSVDMQQLLKSIGATPDQISRVLATAEANRRKPPTALAPPMMAGGFGGGMPGGGGAAPVMMTGGPPAGGGMPPAPGAADAAGGQGGGRRQAGGGGGGMFGGANLTPEQQKKVKEVMAKVFGGKSPGELSPEERQAGFTKMRAELEKQGIQLPARGGNRGGGAGGEGGGPVAFGALRIPGGFTQKDLDQAKLPPPPEENANQLDVLLRPGLLADVEIIVEKIPNAVYIPAQAIFEREGKSVVFVKQGGKFLPRPVRPLKRSESLMIIADGLKAGEEISMQDPDAKPSDKKKGGGQGEGGGAPAMPMGMGKKG